MAKKRSAFAGKTVASAKKNKLRNSSYGYLSLPGKLPVYQLKNRTKVYYDVLPFEVGIPNHPDFDKKTKAAEKGTLWYKLPLKVHKNIGVNRETVVCPTTFGKKCPICEHRKELANRGVDKDKLKAYKTSDRNLYYVVPRKDEAHKAVAHVFDYSDYLLQQLIDEELIDAPENETFPDASTEGKTLRVRFSEESFAGNKFMKATRVDFLERTKAIPKKLYADLPCLSTLVNVLTYDELKALFYEETDEIEPNSYQEQDDSEGFVEEDDEGNVEEDESPPLPFDEDEEDNVEEDEEDEEDNVEEDEEDNVEEDEEDDIPFDEDDPFDDEEEECDEDNVEEDKPKPKKKKSKKTGKGKCPHGHKFGEDVDEFEECESCDLWEDCISALE